MKANKLITALGKTLRAKSPEILTAIGVAGIFVTAITAVRATPKASKLIEEKKEELDVEKLSVVETVKTTWKLYLPSAASAILASAAMIGATSIAHNRIAVMATVATAVDLGHQKYIQHVEKVGGKELVEKVRQDIIDEDLSKVDENIIWDTGYGHELFFSTLTGGYFWSSVAAVKDAECTLVKLQASEMWISWNDYCYQLNIPTIDKRVGDVLGWHIADRPIEFIFDSKLTPSNKPCIVLDVSAVPIEDYSMR